MPNNEPEEPCLMTTDDEDSMLYPPIERPVGPEWWEGRWPHQGLGSPSDLERWLEGRLAEARSMHRSSPDSLGGIALDLGRQAGENATRYLARYGSRNPPPRPKADQLLDFAGVQDALEALIRHIKTEQSATAGASNNSLDGPSTATTPAASRDFDGDATPTPDEQASGPETFVVDGGTFTVRWQDRTCHLGNTKPFRLLVRLAQGRRAYVSINRLIDSIWPGQDNAEKNTVQKTVGNLRRRLKDAGMGDLIIAQPDNYALSLPDGTPCRCVPGPS